MVQPPSHENMIRDRDVNSSLEQACWDGNLPLAQMLLPRLQRLALANNSTIDMTSFLRNACHRHNLRLITYLLASGAILAPTIPIDTARHSVFRVSKPKTIALWTFFLEHGWDVNTIDSGGNTALTCAIMRWNLTLLKFLLENGADANLNSKTKTSVHPRNPNKVIRFGVMQGRRPLDMAAQWWSVESIQILLSHGARIEDSKAFFRAATSREGYSAVRRTEVLRFLLDELGVDINQIERVAEVKGQERSRNVGTALMYAAVWGNVEIVRFLLRKGADATIMDADGVGNALFWASRSHRYRPGEGEEIVGLLVEAGAE